MFASPQSLEILDLRHFGASALRPLLLQEAALWERRLFWDYKRSIQLLLEYVDSRSLTGYVAMRSGRLNGYAFGVCEATKAVLGDVYAFSEGEGVANPTSELLLHHLLETLQATPGIDRIESQLLLFPGGALYEPFVAAGMQSFARHFMVCELPAAQPNAEQSTPPAARPQRWQPEDYIPAAELIHEAYVGHTDSEINDQYRTLLGARRFLHNIVHFPGCGIFDSSASWVLREPGSGAMLGVVLCSRVRDDSAHITQLCVRPVLRGEGLGSTLLQHCLEHLAQHGVKTVSLTVTEGNLGARRLYERHGFRTLHRFEAWVWNKHR